MPHKNLQSHLPNQSFPSGSGSRQPSGGSSSVTEEQLRIKCEAEGGVWNVEKKVCIQQDRSCPEGFHFNTVSGKCEPDSIQPTGRPTGLKVPEFFTDVKTERPSGVTIDGKTFFGLNKEEIEEITARKARREGVPAGTAPVGTAQAEAERQRRVEELQRTETPVRRELDPFLQPGETIPVIGPLLVKIKNELLKRGLKQRGILDIIKGKPGQTDVFELEPEILRTAALTEIERREIERGLTDSEKFGSFVEALPAGILADWVPGLKEAELPSQNVQTVLKSLRILKSRAIDVELKFQKGLLTGPAAKERLNLIKNEVQVGESRMKLLIQDSPELKFNSDGVNFIELKILEVRERLFDSEIAVEQGIPGTPTDLDILIALQAESKAALQEDFEIPE